MLTSRRTIRIEWGDCDGAGIVFYPRYFEWFDACTHGLFERAGLPMARLLAEYRIVGIPMVDTRARFLQPSTFGDELGAESTIVRWGRSSFDVQHRLRRDATIAVEGFETRVWTVREGERLKGAPVPEAVKAVFASAIA
jgi:4-hydroxybenzoyl-CoA thioesterase